MPKESRDTTKRGYRDILLRILGDGEWHTFPECYYALESAIPPERAAERYRRNIKDVAPDLDAQIREGREIIVINALGDISTEQQGFRNERRTRKYRWRPDMKTRDTAQENAYARQMFRPLMLLPDFRACVERLVASPDVNPAQLHFLTLALQPEDKTEEMPFSEEPDGND